jgi:hypothetical protein
MKKLTDMTINELDTVLYSALPFGYNTEVTNGTCLDDTIKVTKDGSTLAMYIGWDETADGVLNATVYDEGDDGDEFVEDGIYWDVEAGATVESIAADIVKHI